MKKNLGITALVIVVALLLTVTFYTRRSSLTEIMDDMTPLPIRLDRESQRVIDDVEAIESIIRKDFGINDNPTINQATMAFIRSKRYGYRSSGIAKVVWKNYTGHLLEEAGIDVTEEANQASINEILALSDSMAYIKDPRTRVKIDFPHTIAVVDVEYTDISEDDRLEEFSDYFMSWGGDLETFLMDMNDYSKASGIVDYDGLYAFALKTMASETPSFFSQEDYYADIDGLNIQRLMVERDMLLSAALDLYYSGGHFARRQDRFIDAHGGYERWESFVRAFMLGIVPEAYEGDEDFARHLRSVRSMSKMMRILVYDQTEEPSQVAREAATDVFLELMSK